MIRNALLYLSNQPRVFKFVKTNRLAKGFASRFVAGETLESAVPAVRELNKRGITASLDLLGESVHNEQEARAAGAEYLKILDRIAREKLDANVSVKLTAMGLDVSEELCVSIMYDVLERARKYNSFVRLDMEASNYTQKTLELFENRLYPEFRGTVGVVLQSYLYRTQADVEHMNALGARVRICKGAYKEPASVAFPDKRDVDANYVKCMRELVLNGNYPGIATHDETIIEATQEPSRVRTRSARISSSFRCCTGCGATCRKKSCAKAGACAVTFRSGRSGIPYLMRRLAERPANVAFMTGNIVKEMVRGRR